MDCVAGANFLLFLVALVSNSGSLAWIPAATKCVSGTNDICFLSYFFSGA
jgi:hypothetical protein